MKRERTFIAIKHDAIQRQLIGEIISRFEKRGLKLAACKLVLMTKEKLAKLYPDEEWWYRQNGEKRIADFKRRGVKGDFDPLALGRQTRERIFKGFSNRPMLVMVWEGPHAVALGRKTVGSTNPLEADVGTIRGDFTAESFELADSADYPVQNLVHAAGSSKEAEREIKLWFSKDEILDYPFLIEKLLLDRHY